MLKQQNYKNHSTIYWNFDIKEQDVSSDTQSKDNQRNHVLDYMKRTFLIFLIVL